MAKVKVNDVELYYEEKGVGPPLLLVAGLASDSQSWLPVSELLAKHHRVILPDNRGVGRTTPQTVPTGIEPIARDCLALLDHLEVDRAHLLGHSLGGTIALHLAARHPQRFDRVVVAASGVVSTPRVRAVLRDLVELREAIGPRALWFKMLFHWLFAPAFFVEPARVNAAAMLSANYAYPQSDASFRAQVEAFEAYGGPPDLRAIDKDVLVLCGSEDILITPHESAESLKGLPRARFETLAGAGHSLHWDAPADFVQAVTRFLKE